MEGCWTSRAGDVPRINAGMEAMSIILVIEIGISFFIHATCMITF